MECWRVASGDAQQVIRLADVHHDPFIMCLDYLAFFRKKCFEPSGRKVFVYHSAFKTGGGYVEDKAKSRGKEVRYQQEPLRMGS
jgi:hypothetical protein